MLSLATLAGLGAAVWMFLSGGGLNQLAVPPGGAAVPAATQGVGFGSPGAWNSGPTAPTGATPAVGTPILQPTTAGVGAPPSGDGPTFRMASFNIEVFGKQKAEDPRVAYTLAEIVRQFSVVAIQEIRTQDDFHMPNFVKLLNATGRKYDFVVGPRIGNTRSTEQYAFVFDTERIMVDRNTVFTVGDPDNLLHREPLVASFSTRMPPDSAFTFTLVNVHTDPDVVPAELEALAEVFREVRRTGRGEDDVIMLGDFNANDAQMTKQSRLGKIPGVTPLIGGVYSNTRQNKLYDNLLVHLPSTTEYVGRSGVYNFGQAFNLSPGEAEQVSDHFPVWAEFSAYERDYTGRIASRGANAR
jgi:endonuclease/exonuclease/phosphatase family metal-dependent hydrolase